MGYREEKFLELLNKSKKIVFMTGAGVSTHSGIPDYRSANGIYSDNPEYMLSEECWKKEYLKFLQFITEHFDLKNFEPNEIHKWIKSLEKDKEVTVITQNIDGLHEKAGSSNVICYHGNINKWSCNGCFKDYNFEYVKEHNYCECGCKLKPNVVLYGQDIPNDINNKAIEVISNADLLIVIGTSLTVFPFASLIEFFPITKPTILFNKTKTENYYSRFTLDFIEDALDFINKIK